jgi:F-type H+-transporting ATPase subunit epsilon
MSLNVELVSPTQRVWSGEATSVSARTIDGDLGILTGHTSLFGVLVDGVVSITSVDGSTTDFNVSGGFLSVSNNRVSILTETVSN